MFMFYNIQTWREEEEDLSERTKNMSLTCVDKILTKIPAEQNSKVKQIKSTQIIHQFSEIYQYVKTTGSRKPAEESEIY